MNKERILGISPLIELAIRKVYYSKNPLLKKLVEIVKRNDNKLRGFTDKGNSQKIEKWTAIQKYIEGLNIRKGDLLIVHSSAEEFSRIGANLKEVLLYLFELVGEEGTLVIPCFPLYDDKNFDEERQVYVYAPKRTVCSTGLLPNLFIRTKGVVRSQFPWNSLAAKGPLAEEMMRSNLETDLAHGKGSAWEFCMNHNAKILLLGVNSSHTTTMVHVAEDVLDENWPIDGWYEERCYVIKNNGTDEQVKRIRVRKPEWVKYNASWYRSCQFAKQGILNEQEIEGFNVGFIEDSKKMVDFIIGRTLKHKPFFVVPKRCYKR